MCAIQAMAFSDNDFRKQTYQTLGPVTEEDRESVYQALETYCDQDRWGPHKVIDVIEHLSGTKIAAPAICVSGITKKHAQLASLSTSQPPASWFQIFDPRQSQTARSKDLHDSLVQGSIYFIP
jgi:hypothetical protein